MKYKERNEIRCSKQHDTKSFFLRLWAHHGLRETLEYINIKISSLCNVRITTYYDSQAWCWWRWSKQKERESWRGIRGRQQVNFRQTLAHARNRPFPLKSGGTTLTAVLPMAFICHHAETFSVLSTLHYDERTRRIFFSMKFFYSIFSSSENLLFFLAFRCCLNAIGT